MIRVKQIFLKHCLSKMTKTIASENLCRTCCVFLIFYSTKSSLMFYRFSPQVLDFNCVNLFSLETNKRKGKIRKGVCVHFIKLLLCDPAVVA